MLRLALHDVMRRGRGDPGGNPAYDVCMTPRIEVTVEEVIADPGGLLERIERDREAVSVIRGEEVVAVISPAQIAETLADIHRAIQENPPQGTWYLDVMETRRLLGL